MRRSFDYLLAMGICSLALTTACSSGSDKGGFQQVGGNDAGGGSSKGSSAANGGHSTTSSSAATTDGAGASTAVTIGPAAGAGGFPNTTTGVGGSEGIGGSEIGGSSGTGGSGSCMANTPCANAVSIGSIRGDDNNDMLMNQGETAAWFTVDVVEDDDFIDSLSFNATLDSPSGVVFQLYAYTPSDAGPNCTVTPAKGFGTPQQINGCWGDSFGSTDDKTIVFEVRYVSGGTCGGGAQWAFSITGNPDDGTCP